MIYKKNDSAVAAGVMTATNEKSFALGEYAMKATIIVAGIIASNIIIQNKTIFTQQEVSSGSVQMLLLGMIMLGCCIRCIVDEFILSPCADKKHLDTLECGRRIHFLSNDELVKLFIIEGCPQVRGVNLQDNGSIYLRGKHTKHYVEFGQEGATIDSGKKDYRAIAEANAIIKVLAKACN